MSETTLPLRPYIPMIQPRTDQERLKAARVCRANSARDVETGEFLTEAAAHRQWANLVDSVEYEVWIWMWNHGREYWDHFGPVGKLS